MKLAAIYRHPVKSLGEERIAATVLEPNRHVAWDRVWAIAHGASNFDPADPKWHHCREFVRQTHAPTLARLSITFDDATRQLTLAHPERGEITLDPDAPEGASALADWIAPLAEQGRPGPYSVCRIPDGAFTDAEERWITLASVRSRAVLEQRAGRPLEDIRFRINLWIDGMAPWEELELVGKDIVIGATRMRVMEPVERCRATEAGPQTGTHDTPVLSLLREATGAINFGIYAEVTEGGPIAEGDTVLIE